MEGHMGVARTIVTASALAGVGLLVFFQAEPAHAQGAPSPARIKQDYRRAAPRPIENRALVDLGHDLFFDPKISASGKTACASCHNPALGYGVTDAHSLNDAGKALVGWDGRSPTLEAQVIASTATGSMPMQQTDTPGKVETIVARIGEG